MQFSERLNRQQTKIIFLCDNTNFKRKTVTEQPFQGQGSLFHQWSNCSIYAYALRKLHVGMSDYS